MARRLLLILTLFAGATLCAVAAAIPAGKVRVDICEEGLPADNSWPTAALVTESYDEDLFGLFELPQKYVGTGVRGDRPFLFTNLKDQTGLDEVVAWIRRELLYE